MARRPSPCSGRYSGIVTSGTREIGRVGIPPTKIPVPAAFYPVIGCRVSTRGTDSPLRKVARYPSMIPEFRVSRRGRYSGIFRPVPRRSGR
eukprot:scaffold3946_cov41-Cyclotella_meneghiniana.AAC.1